MKLTFFVSLLLIFFSSYGLCQKKGKSLPGRWSGVDGEGTKQTFIFNGNGKGQWVIGSGEHSGVFEIKYQIDVGTDPHHIELSGFETGPLKGRILYGILEFQADTAFRLDLEPGPKGADASTIRPDSFTAQTVIYHREQAIKHIVLVWLKEPGNEQDRYKLIEASYSFREIPGVIGVSAGTPLQSERPEVDDSFDMAVIITFESREALQRYETHPVHTRAVDEILRPLTARMAVYDFVER